MENKLFSVMCYDVYGHCYKRDFVNFDNALDWALAQFKHVNFQIVRMVSPYQDNDVLYMSKVGY